MKDVIIAALPVLGGVIPAYLLYLQNKRTSQQESDDRAAERRADETRRAQELKMEELRLREQGLQTAADRERERYAAFLRVVHRVQLGIENAANTSTIYVFTPGDQDDLSTTYEDLMLDAPGDVAAAVAAVRERISEAVSDSADHPAKVVGDLEVLRAAVEDVRNAVTKHLTA